jgi:hypothetical protein
MNKFFAHLLGLGLLVSNLNAEQAIQALSTGTQHIVLETRIVPVLPDYRRDTDTLNVSFPFSRFDTNLGTLDEVKIGFFSNVDPAYTGGIYVASIAGMNAHMNCQHSLRPPGGSPTINRSIVFNQSGTFAANPPVTIITLDYPGQSIDTGFINVSASTLSYYLGSGQVLIPFQLDLQQEVSISDVGMVGLFQMDVSITVALIYEFTPPPTILGLDFVDQTSRLLSWTAKPGSTYSIQMKDVVEAPWGTLTNVVATSNTHTASVPIGTNDQRFYRVGRIIP